MRLIALVLALFVLNLSLCEAASDKPNVLIVMADDCTHNDLPLYGGKNARTPNIQRFAEQSLVFNRAYLSEAMCQPCRAELFTGKFPMRNGCAWNHSASHNDTHSLPQLLSPLGYRVGIAGKVHVKPRMAFPFENVSGFDPNCVRNPTHTSELNGIKEFMTRDADRPFCLVIALVEPHVPWVMGDASAYPPKKIQLPDNIANTKLTREAFSRYLAEITYMDGQFGQILEQLQASGQADDTLVLFTSEQGSQFPGCKWTNWDTGLHTALVARWPGQIAPGQRTDAIVQYADVVPTLVELGGGKTADARLDGRSFAGVLRGTTTAHREFAYGVHNNIPEGPSYPIRTVTDGTWRYIRNLRPDEMYIEKHLMGVQGTGKLNNPYWHTWIGEAWNNPDVYALTRRYTRRPAEQLYRTADDPYEMTNHANDAGYAGVKQRLSKELDRWLKEQNDPGAPQDTHEAHQAAKKGEHLYVPAD